jgi:hypothetical protein
MISQPVVESEISALLTVYPHLHRRRCSSRGLRGAKINENYASVDCVKEGL